MMLAVIFLILSTQCFTSGSAAAQTWIPGAIEFSRLAGFGQAIVIDNDQVIATRTGESVMFPSPASQKGGVFVFASSEEGWQQIHELVPDAIKIGDRFGHAMALSGDILTVSAPGANQGCGAILVFKRDESAGWKEEALLDNEMCKMDERMGWALAIADDRLYAGAPGTDETPGAVHIFVKEAGAWQLSRKIQAPRSGMAFGESIAAWSGGFMVGAPNAADGKGMVYVYNRAFEAEELTASDHSVNLFGLEIVVHEKRALIGGARVARQRTWKWWISGGRARFCI